MGRVAVALLVAFVLLVLGYSSSRADHNIYLPLVPNTPIMQEAFAQRQITYCLNDRASQYPQFAAQIEDVNLRYRALGFNLSKVSWGQGCELQHNMVNFDCGGCAAHVFYANWPVVIEYKYTLGYTDWRSAVGHEMGHALLGLHERYRDSGGFIGCVGPESGRTVMDCGAPHVRYPQPLDIERFCALPGAQVMAGCISIQTLIRSYDWEDETALAVFTCESALNPLVVGGLGERGIAQIHPVHAANFDWENAFNPKVNLDYAYKLWQQFGWQPWACFTETCIGVTVGWNPCTARWYMPDGWSFDPVTLHWWNPDNQLEWGPCTDYGGRYNLILGRWFKASDSFADYGWSVMPAC